ncbi:hypothetical protein Pmani_033666 [Petrolisthes manimaculis]|uniref:Uncharacterized protein n=1 Tax=Petrolisthes manimaculis TaxID=1843537 RepID=A0AAE1NQT5_9EUCA|nr:hypothetical protein Pmani_033666 [Petrolisthes manimaculis]
MDRTERREEGGKRGGEGKRGGKREGGRGGGEGGEGGVGGELPINEHLAWSSTATPLHPSVRAVDIKDLVSDRSDNNAGHFSPLEE